MDRGFNLTLNTQYYPVNDYAIRTYKDTNRQHIQDLADVLIDNDTLDASLIIKKLFPTVNADIFLSHSSKDIDQAIQISEDLRACGIIVFIDSLIWGSVYDLLKAVDNKYCLKSDQQTYDYDLRNQTTAHLHMALSSALQHMIDETETILFMNTDQSISLKHSINGDQKTLSPWIHMELSFSSLVRRRSRRVENKRSGVALDHAMESLNVAHDAPTDHLTKITEDQFNSWMRSAKIDGRKALDRLYQNF